MTTTLVRVGNQYLNLGLMHEIRTHEHGGWKNARDGERKDVVRLFRGEIAGRDADGEEGRLLTAYLEGEAVGHHTYTLPGGIEVVHLLPPEPGVVVDDEAGAEAVEALEEAEAGR